MLLEDRLTPDAPAWLYERPVEVVRCNGPGEIEGAFDQLEAGLRRGLHAAGVLGYELGYVLEPRLRPLLPAYRPFPLLWMGLFPAPTALAASDLDAFFAGLGPPPPLQSIKPDHDRADHAERVRQVLARIAAGEIYQANLTFQFRFHYAGDPMRFYAALRTRQPTAHSGFAAFDDTQVLSVSPELFLRVGVDGDAESRPMKGTAARSVDPSRDAEAAAALVADPKQRAENLMITDLIRNDLARISEPGSVRVPRLFTPESHPTFHALTSTVTARLRSGVSLKERVGAMFPCGSIVGAPKIKATEVLAGLESGARGPYTGALGVLRPDGSMNLNVAIRTAVLRSDGWGAYGVGGGVVADSDPHAEYDEALLKARVLQDLARDYGLIETLRWSARFGFRRFSRHLDRLAKSAAALGFLFDRSAAEAELADSAATWAATAGEDRRVRLLLQRTGELEVTDAPAPRADERVARLGVSVTRLDAGDPFLRHKTTRRDAYDAAASEGEAAGWDEALLLNRSGALADASRHSVFVQTDGRLITPPLAAGALPGVLRAELIAEGRAVEEDLPFDAVASAEALFIGNSLRGFRRAAFIVPP